MRTTEQLLAAAQAASRARDAHHDMLYAKGYTTDGDYDEAERLEQAYLAALAEFRPVVRPPTPTRVDRAPRGWSFHGAELRQDEFGTPTPSRAQGTGGQQ
jgi:hypothetical protein